MTDLMGDLRPSESLAPPQNFKERVISRASGTHRSWPKDTIVEANGPANDGVVVLLSGWAGRIRLLTDGRRQITRLLLPGDVCQARALAELNGPVVALTDAKTVSWSGSSGDASSEDFRYGQMLAQAAIRQELADLINHVVRLGRMSAYERTAHMFLELYERLACTGQTRGNSMPVPLTQDVFADLLGLSVVHVNRTLQQLRRKGLIAYRSGEFRILDVLGLAAVCDYEFTRARPRTAEPRSFAAARPRAST